ncbi:MAG TPA: PEGA domain-containing protein, partial [Kofleriaceae bacterium]
MGNRRLALFVGASLCFSASVFAQPAEGEIEMEGEQPPADQPAQQPSDQPQPVVKDPKVAKKWQQAGDVLMKKGDYLTGKGKPEAKQHYENAVTAYQKAIEASDDVSLNYQLALAEDKAGMTPDAMKHIKLVIAAQGIKPALMKNAQTKLDELSMKVGLVTLVITPEGTQVSLEGKLVGEAPMTDPLVLMPGTHRVSLTAVGFQPKDIDLKIEAGSESERKIALEPVPVVNKPEGPEEPETPLIEQPKGPNKLPMYIGAGTAAGLTLIATVTGIVAIVKHGTYTDTNATPTERADAQSSGKTFAHVTDICLVGAVGAAAFTAYWYQYKYRPHVHAAAEHRDVEAKVDVVP